MNTKAEVNPGEIKLIINEAVNGTKLFLSDFGLTSKELNLPDGNLRLVIEMNNLAENHFNTVPTIHLAYSEELKETHWQCDFNDELVLDKKDHHGQSTILLLNKTKLTSLIQRHENALVIHGDLPDSAHLIAETSYLLLF